MAFLRNGSISGCIYGVWAWRTPRKHEVRCASFGARILDVEYQTSFPTLPTIGHPTRRFEHTPGAATWGQGFPCGLFLRPVPLERIIWRLLLYVLVKTA